MLREVDEETGSLRLGVFSGKLQPGKVYSGGQKVFSNKQIVLCKEVVYLCKRQTMNSALFTTVQLYTRVGTLCLIRACSCSVHVCLLLIKINVVINRVLSCTAGRSMQAPLMHSASTLLPTVKKYCTWGTTSLVTSSKLRRSKLGGTLLQAGHLLRAYNFSQD